jgi:N-glycosylase/DNA lyase
MFSCQRLAIPATEMAPGKESMAAAFPLKDYDLPATFTCGQAFRWQQEGQDWTGIVGGRWVRLRAETNMLFAQTAVSVSNWQWLKDYLQMDLDLNAVLSTFPQDEPMRAAVGRCRGLRLLRQDPWECLASFITSSNKRIVQIRQIICLLCRHFGEPLPAGKEACSAFAFPSPAQLADASEAELRACKLGFRAPYLLETARIIARGQFDLHGLRGAAVERARLELMELPGVGRKIADCVLLFAYGHQAAFPVDVWIMKALRELYFPRGRMVLSRLREFAATHFGPNAGYAQQYLFHYMRTLHAARGPASVQARAARLT